MSTFANVYVGAAPNDLTGDTLRDAFQTINQNFANIAAGTANITVNSPVRSVAGRTGNIILGVNAFMVLPATPGSMLKPQQPMPMPICCIPLQPAILPTMCMRR